MRITWAEAESDVTAKRSPFQMYYLIFDAPLLRSYAGPGKLRLMGFRGTEFLDQTMNDTFLMAVAVTSTEQ